MRFLLLTLVMALGLTVGGCISDELTDSPSATLSFSTDTVSFDTVFTDLGTPTARLIVHNRNKKGVNISSIRFSDPDGYFRMNVDGVSGRTFSDVEIRGEDSIYVFIECYIPQSESAEPHLVSDRLEFVTNGVSQNVEVEAWGQNVTRLHGLTVESDMTLTAERPYVVFDSLKVMPGATLRVEPGTRLLFHDKAEMIVEGTLDARGEVGKMIQMRGDRLDNVLPDVGYDIMAGQWKGITLRAGSFDNRMEYVDMRSTQHGVVVDSCSVLDRSKLLLVNSWLHNSQCNVLQSKYAQIDAYGCCFSEASGAVVELTGGRHNFVQCTIANNYLFSAISSPLLSLYHLLPEDAEADPANPLMRATFENGIIYGLAADINVDDLTGSDVILRYMLLKAKGNDDDNFINCLWDKDPLFYTDRPKYLFNYRLRPDSPAIGAGDAAYVTEICRYDMDGLDRLAGGAPALGAYVYTPPKEEEK
jgi:hypothetical protein